MQIEEISRACPSRDVLEQFLSNGLSEADASDVESHVNSCASCLEYVGELALSAGDTRASADSLLGQETPIQTSPPDARILLGLSMLASDAADDVPPRLAGFEVRGQLGAGGMGVVWRVRDLEFGRDLALKVMKGRFSGDAGLERRFLNEAHVCGRLTHPGIVPVHALGRLGDARPYYLMKVVGGQTLASLFKGRNERTEGFTEWIHIFAQVCQAVAYAHSQKVIHRDLKPANVMVGEHGEVQLMDWGVAKSLVCDDAANAAPGQEELPDDTGKAHCGHTRPGSHLGTWAYMPPEQARGLVDEMDERSDVFGLGAILCEILTGKPAYTASDMPSLRQQATEARLDEALKRLDACPADPALIQLARRCLAADRADRPANAGELAAEVAAYQAKEEERSRQAEVDAATTATRRRAQRRTRWTLAMLAALSVLMVWGVAAYLAPPQRDPNTIRVGIKPWVGYTPLAVADELKLFGPRVRLEFVPIAGLEEAGQALLKGEIDVAMWLVDTHALARSSNLPAKVVLKLDDSLEADAFVARKDIASFADLKGMRVAFQKEEASHFLLLALCEKFGIDDRDITLVPATAKEAADLFIQGEVDAAATYDPHLTRALRAVPGAWRVASGAHAPGTIVDVLTVDETYLEEYRDNVKALIAGWFKAVAILTDPTSDRHAEAMRIACKFNGLPGADQWRTSTPCTPEEYQEMAAGMRFSDRADNIDYFRIDHGSSKFRDLYSIAEKRWRDLGHAGRPTRPEDGDGSGILFER